MLKFVNSLSLSLHVLPCPQLVFFLIMSIVSMMVQINLDLASGEAEVDIHDPLLLATRLAYIGYESDISVICIRLV